MKRLSEDAKLDVALTPQSLDGNDTGEYYDMSKFRRGLFVLNCGEIVKDEIVKMEILQAKDADGSDSKALKDIDDDAVVATITGPANATEATLTLATVVNGDEVTINGLTFTAHTDTTTEADREFAIDESDTEDAAELVTCINDETYGVPGVTATSAAAVVTLKATDPGETLITVEDDAVTITPAVTVAQSYIDIQTALLDNANDFTHVAAKVTTESASVVGVVLARYGARYMPEQKVGASSLV
jgi:DNA/RNA endonuclease YhcR with UshA esterase domain